MSLSATNVDPLSSILDHMDSDEEFEVDHNETLTPQFTVEDLPSPSTSDRSDLESLSSAASSNDSKNRYLYPKIDTVEEFRPEEVRWFYKETDKKSVKWTPFIGYDSLRIECKYRELQSQTKTSEVEDDSNTDSHQHDDLERIWVRGSLFEVDVRLRKCLPIYWSSEGKTIESTYGSYQLNGLSSSIILRSFP